ncbi:hypothetical protein Hanom_Chr11g00994671 [Helianthus anomalus]
MRSGYERNFLEEVGFLGGLKILMRVETSCGFGKDVGFGKRVVGGGDGGGYGGGGRRWRDGVQIQIWVCLNGRLVVVGGGCTWW